MTKAPTLDPTSELPYGAVAAAPAPATPSATITTIVVTFNSAAEVAGCLGSLAAQIGDIANEIVVVDNASSDDTIEVVRAVMPTATVLRMGANRGYAAAVNAALAMVDARRTGVLVLNPDVRLGESAVRSLVTALADDGVGVAVPLLVDRTGRLCPSLRHRPTAASQMAEALLGGSRASRLCRRPEVIADGAEYRQPRDVDWATGAVMLIGRRCLDDVGGFDESFFLYSEETDFMLRAGDAGYAVRYVPSARAVHLGGDLRHDPRLWALRTVNRVRLHRRRHTRRSSVAFLGASLLGEGLRAAAGRGPSRAALLALSTNGLRLALGPPPPPEPAPPGWVCFSAQDWWYHNRAHSDFQLMRRVAARRPVLLVNSIGLRVPRRGRSTNPGRRIARKAASVSRLVRRPMPAAPGLRVMTPVAIPTYRSPTLRALNARLVHWQVSAAARLEGVSGPGRPDPVVALTMPTAIDAAERMRRSALVVYRSDKHSCFPEADSEVIRALETRCVRGADQVFYSSDSLQADERDHAGDRSRRLDHGVDVHHFVRRARTELPTELTAIPGPRLGFFGGIHDYQIDLALLAALADALPGCSVVLVGPASCSLDELERRTNVHVLGPRRYDEVPAYGSGFDVALMPWLDNQWIRFANPVKLKEYLALGLPVVSTDFPEVHRYADLIRVAPDTASFIEAVRLTLRDGGLGDARARRERVEHSTWDAAAASLLRSAESVIDPRPAGSGPIPPLPPAGTARRATT